MVTGATGLVGSLFIKAVLVRNDLKKSNITILALVRDIDKAKNVFKEAENTEKLNYVMGNITEKLEITENIDYIIHSASITSSKIFVSNPVETIQTILYGTESILKLAIEKKVKKVVFLSTMEVYGLTDQNKEYITEKDIGYIDNLNIRSCYSEGKRMAECMCASYKSEYGVPVVIARLAQTFGAGTDIKDTRVFAQFARSAMNGDDIELHTDGSSVGNYCYSADAIAALLFLLSKGEDGEAYTVVNEKNTMSIKEMAYMVAEKIAGGKIKVKINDQTDIMKLGYAPKALMRLSSKKINDLGWVAQKSLVETYERMIESMKID